MIEIRADGRGDLVDDLDIVGLGCRRRQVRALRVYLRYRAAAVPMLRVPFDPD